MAPRSNLQYLKDNSELARMILVNDPKSTDGIKVNILNISMTRTGSKIYGNIFCDFIDDMINEMGDDTVQYVVGSGSDISLALATRDISTNRDYQVDAIGIRYDCESANNDPLIGDEYANLKERVILITSAITDGQKERDALKILEERGLRVMAIFSVYCNDQSVLDELKKEYVIRIFNVFTNETLHNMEQLDIKISEE